MSLRYDRLRLEDLIWRTVMLGDDRVTFEFLISRRFSDSECH